MLKNSKQQEIRNSSIEFLRIIAMVMIVACHFATHGQFSFDTRTLTIPQLWWNFIEMGGYLGVDIFVLISGYFLVKNNGIVFNLKRILKFWSQVFIYSITIYSIYAIIVKQDFELISFVKAIFPITFSSWWFASTYFVLYLIHPFINMLLLKIDQKTYQVLITTQLILWCFIPTFTSSKYQSNNLLWFVTLYCLAGYIRLFGLNPRFTIKNYVGFWLFFSALRYLSCIALIAIGTKFPFAARHSLFFYNKNSILTFLSALSLFMIFAKWNMGYIKWVNIIASATFGVYLIHENAIVRPLLWQEIFKNAQYQDSMFLIPYSVIVVAIVFAVCTLIDLLRQHIIEKPFMILVNRYSEKVIKPFETVINIVKRFVFGTEN